MVKTRVPLLFAMVLAAVASSPAVADVETFDLATKSEIQHVISGQLDALRREDAKAAEDFATPAIRDKFPEPSKFFDMVKQHYAALLHPRTTTFGETAGSPHGPLQKVTFVAADGTIWQAIYSLQRVNGEWRISGCGLEKDASQQDI